jgi:colanic acid/amylovoran biosynthesis protein
MFLAVAQELKQRFPEAKLFVNNNKPDEALIKSAYGNNFKIIRKASFYKFVSRFRLVRLTGLVSRKLSCYFTEKHAVKGADIVFNIGGFQFGDQWNHNKTNIANWEDYLKKLHQYGAKIVFLPQAFGPFEKKASKKMLKVLNNNADLLIARDDVSYNYIMGENVDKNKVMLYPDFTASVKGIETEYSKQHKGKVCIIPNSKMIQTGIMDKETYLSAIVKVIDHIYQKGYEVVLLNHEGNGDYLLCKTIATRTSNSVAIVTGLNAAQTKGVIGASYMVISSRFHGVANALSSCTPCLATSWSHKYQKLLEEYEQNDNLLKFADISMALDKIDNMLDSRRNTETREILAKRNEMVKAKNREMWDAIWNKMSV